MFLWKHGGRMRRSFLAGILLAVVAFGIWCYDANHMVDTNYEENALLKGNSHLENETSGVEDKGTVQYQDCIVLDAEKWQGNYSKTFIVTDKTKVPISTLITVYFTYESNDNGGYSIVSIDSVKAEKNSGWTYVDNVATVNGDILYSNQRSEAVIPITYQASIGSGLEPQECLILLDLSQKH